MQCLADEIVADFVQANLSPGDLASVDVHLDSCEDCRMLVAALAGTISPSGAAAETRVAAPRLGRYILLDVVGQGAMGIVYAAYDPRLDRKIAIKLLHAEPASTSDRRGPSRQERFLREAKAMARLVHPQVVTVHDTGTAEAQVFVAMEYVDGMNLRAWLAAAPRDTAAIIRAFTQAGTGLAAAHKAGIVHRDFKPDNVFVDKEGRVKVGDFGLVSFATGEPNGSRASHEIHHSSDATVASLSAEEDAWDPESTLTQTGTRMGTALYMSPEQFDARVVGPASDQFSFCVALYEALYGIAPFAGNTGREIRQAIEEQKFTTAAKREVPGWIHRIVVRGLHKDASKRHGSMDELLRSLARDPTRARRRRLIAAGVSVALLAPILALVLWQQDRAAGATCAAPTEGLEGVWDEQKRSRLQAAFASNSNPRALHTAGRVSAAFDAYADSWLAMRVQTCKATHEQGFQSEHLMDLRVDCLDRKLAGLAVQTETFIDQASRPEFVDLAAAAALSIPAISDCMDSKTLLGAAPRPGDPVKAQALSRVEKNLDTSVALENVGQFADALRLAQAAVSDARPLGYPPAYINSLYQVAVLQYELAQYDAAKDTLALVVQTASADADDQKIADAWLLLQTLAVVESNYDEAERIEPWVQAAVLRAGNRPSQRAKLVNSKATVHLRKGRYAEAEADFLEGLRLLESQEQPNPTDVANVYLNLGITALSQANMEVAGERLAMALQLQERALGPEHPDVARVLLSICSRQHASAEFDEAEQTCSRSLAIREQALGAMHPDLAHPLGVLADLARKKQDNAVARAFYERALAIQEKALDPMHPNLGTTLTNLGDLLSEMGEHELAGTHLKRALHIKRKTLGDKHQFVGITLHNLGNWALASGDHAQALEYQEQALALFEEVLSADHSYLAYALSALGEIHLKSGDARRAISPLRRAVLIRSAQGADPIGLAQSQVLLARALLQRSAASGEKGEALALARAAEQSFLAIGKPASDDLQAVQSWLKRAE